MDTSSSISGIPADEYKRRIAAKGKTTQGEEVGLTMTADQATVTRSGQTLGTITLTNMGIVYEGRAQKISPKIPSLVPPTVAANAAQVSPTTSKFLSGEETGTQTVSGLSATGSNAFPPNFWDLLVEMMVQLNKNSTEIANTEMQFQAGEGALRASSMKQAAQDQIEQAEKNRTAAFVSAGAQAGSSVVTIVQTARSSASETEISQAQKDQGLTGEEYTSENLSEEEKQSQLEQDKTYQDVVNKKAAEIQAQDPNKSPEQAQVEAKNSQEVQDKAQDLKNKYESNYQQEKSADTAARNKLTQDLNMSKQRDMQSWGHALSGLIGAGGGAISGQFKYEADIAGAHATMHQSEAQAHATASQMAATAQDSAQKSKEAFQNLLKEILNVMVNVWTKESMKA